MTDPSTPRIDELTLPPAVARRHGAEAMERVNDAFADVHTTTFTFTCPFGCTIPVVDGREQPHECIGMVIVRRGLGYGPGADDAARRVVDELLPVLRDRIGDAWQEGATTQRRITEAARMRTAINAAGS